MKDQATEPQGTAPLPRQFEALGEALEPLLDAISVHEGDTLSSLDGDDRVVFSTSGSWSGSRAVNWGHLRAIRGAAREAFPKPNPLAHLVRLPDRAPQDAAERQIAKAMAEGYRANGLEARAVWWEKGRPDHPDFSPYDDNVALAAVKFALSIAAEQPTG